MKNRWTYIGLVGAVLVALSCGQGAVGQMLIDAGQILRDGGTAHAQTNCTWYVKLGASVPTSGDTEVAQTRGWEPFSTWGTTPMLRQCR